MENTAKWTNIVTQADEYRHQTDQYGSDIYSDVFKKIESMKIE